MKEFVPYQIALDMKSIEFDEECFSFYDYDGELYKSEGYYRRGYNVHEHNEVIAPTFSQAFRWFREKYGLDVNYRACIPTAYIPTIHFTKEEGLTYKCHEMLRFFDRKIFDTKEEAELECLRKLIEIVKQQKSNHDLMSGDIVGY